MAIAGLATAASPFLIGQQAAGAAVTRAGDFQTRNLVTDAGGVMRCSVGLETTHNTDNADQPFFEFVAIVGGDGGCTDSVSHAGTARYRDEGGRLRTTRFGGYLALAGNIQGAYTSTSVTVVSTFINCDESNGTADCQVTVTASPK
jgi:hypothetical protein